MRLIFRNTKENNFLSINIRKSETYDNLFEKLKNKLKPPISVILIIDDDAVVMMIYFWLRTLDMKQYGS